MRGLWRRRWAPKPGRQLKHIPAYPDGSAWPIQRGGQNECVIFAIANTPPDPFDFRCSLRENQRKQREHLEDIFGEERPKVKNLSGKYKRVFEHYQKLADAFGLVLTSLLPTRTQKYTGRMPSRFTVQTLNRTNEFYRSTNRRGNQSKGPTRPVVGQLPDPPQPHSRGVQRSYLRPHQRLAIRAGAGTPRVVPNHRTPNGVRENTHRPCAHHVRVTARKQGPTLMISPIIASGRPARSLRENLLCRQQDSRTFRHGR